jgi:hypothetical protein
LSLFTELPRALEAVEKLDPGTLMAAQTGSRGFKSGFRAPKQAFLNPNRGPEALTGSFSTGS